MDYSLIDIPLLLNYLFYPRRDFTEPSAGAKDIMVPVSDDAVVHCRLYGASGMADAPCLLYFHGNGEVVSDYDYVSPYFLRTGIRIAVADYRGYGKSTGRPSFKSVVSDAPKILDAVRDELEHGNDNPSSSANLWVMGRSLGSISALELAETRSESLRGMVVESGFINIVKLIHHLGLYYPGSPADLAELEQKAYEKAARITIPALLIHGERDSLVPLEQGEELYHALGSKEKKLFTIPLADHNDIFLVETENYLQEIKDFTT